MVQSFWRLRSVLFLPSCGGWPSLAWRGLLSIQLPDGGALGAMAAPPTTSCSLEKEALFGFLCSGWAAPPVETGPDTAQHFSGVCRVSTELCFSPRLRPIPDSSLSWPHAHLRTSGLAFDFQPVLFTWMEQPRDSLFSLAPDLPDLAAFRPEC